MMTVKLTRMRAVLALTLLALTGAAWWAWEQVSRPWGAQAVSFKPAGQQCGQEGQLRYCVHRAAGGVNGDVVYHLSTAPRFYAPTCEALGAMGLGGRGTRVLRHDGHDFRIVHEHLSRMPPRS